MIEATHRIKPPNGGKTAFIYALSDPRDPGQVRYIGKTQNPSSRLYHHHLRYARPNRMTRKDRWIESLWKSGVTPLMEIIDEVPHDDESEWQSLERFYIAYLRFLGADLTNISDGGHGGGSLSQETKQKLRELRNTPEFKAAVSERHKGMKFTDEQRKRCSEAHKGLPRSQSHKDALSRSHLGKKLSPEHCDAISKSRSGKKTGPRSQETRAKLSEAAKRRYKNATQDQMDRWSKISKIAANRPDTLAKRVESMRRLSIDPEYRKKVSDGLRKMHANLTPEQKASRAAAIRRSGTTRRRRTARVRRERWPSTTRWRSTAASRCRISLIR